MQDDERDINFNAGTGLLLAGRLRLLILRGERILRGRLLRMGRNNKKRSDGNAGEKGGRKGTAERPSG